MKAGKLLGKQVVGSRGWKIGKVKELVFDENTWQIGALEVELNRTVAQDYQMKKLLGRSSIAVKVDSVHAVGDQVILAVTKPELRRLVASLREAPTAAVSTK